MVFYSTLNDILTFLPSVELRGTFSVPLCVIKMEGFWCGTRWCENSGFDYLY